MVFTPLGLFPLQTAAVLVSLLNLALWVGAVLLTRDLVARSFPGRNPSGAPLVFAVLLSAQFFLDNFHHVQVNGVILVLVLFGVRASLLGRDVRGAAAIVAATAIKITPIFFAAWLVMRRSRRAAVATIVLGLASVLVPLAIRGPERGAGELVEYYHTFLEGHEKGRIDDYQAGQNLAALVSRMTRPPATTERRSYQYLPAAESTAQLLYRVSWLASLALFLVTLLALRIRGAPVTASEVALVFLTGLLLSPITFTTHLVPLLFVFAVAFSLPWHALGGPEKVFAAVIGVGIVASGLSGRDFAGDRAYEAVAGYSVHAWTMLALLVAMSVLATRGGMIRRG
jgi:hypothetical protein